MWSAVKDEEETLKLDTGDKNFSGSRLNVSFHQKPSQVGRHFMYMDRVANMRKMDSAASKIHADPAISLEKHYRDVTRSRHESKGPDDRCSENF